MSYSFPFQDRKATACHLRPHMLLLFQALWCSISVKTSLIRSHLCLLPLTQSLLPHPDIYTDTNHCNNDQQLLLLLSLLDSHLSSSSILTTLSVQSFPRCILIHRQIKLNRAQSNQPNKNLGYARFLLSYFTSHKHKEQKYNKRYKEEF